MGKKDADYQVVYRGESLGRFVVGGWVFFQRRKEYGGGYWLGRTYEDCFWLEFERPTSLYEGVKYIVVYEGQQAHIQVFNDDFNLT